MNAILKSIIILLPFLLVTLTVSAQEEKKSKQEEITIKTSVVCGMCKDRVEHDLAYEKGVKGVSVNLETKEVTVKYDPNKTTPNDIRKAISKIGYDADDVAADPKAYEKLPKCCRKDAAPH